MTTIPEHVYVYIDFIKENLFGDSYFIFLTTTHLQAKTEHHKFNYRLYRNIEHSFVQSTSVRLFTKKFEEVLLIDSDIPCVVTLHFQKKSSEK